MGALTTNALLATQLYRHAPSTAPGGGVRAPGPAPLPPEGPSPAGGGEKARRTDPADRVDLSDRARKALETQAEVARTTPDPADASPVADPDRLEADAVGADDAGPSSSRALVPVAMEDDSPALPVREAPFAGPMVRPDRIAPAGSSVDLVI